MLTGKGGTERSGIFFSGQVSVGAYIYHAIRDSLRRVVDVINYRTDQ